MAKFNLPKFPKLPTLAEAKAFLASSLKKIVTRLKSINIRSMLPTKEQIKSPTGIALSSASVIAVIVLTVGLSSQAISNNSPANGSSNGNSDSQDYSGQATDDPNQPQASRRPVSGPQTSKEARDAAAEERDRAIRAEKARLSNLDKDDQVLVMMKATLDSYLAIAELAEKKGSSDVRETSARLKAASNKILAEIESLAASRKLEWPKLGVEMSPSDAPRVNAKFYLPDSRVESFRAATDSDFDMSFSFSVVKSFEELLDYSSSRDMPDDKEYLPLTKLILAELSGLSSPSKN